MKMDKELAIKVDNLHKYYRLGVKEESSDSVISAFFSFIKSPIKNYKKYKSLYNFSDDELHDENVLRALDGVSFEIKAGEVVGIIGVNGAGKSTLLKVLSRITSPSKGGVSIRGRVSSLLEVGTGFHPELTGRENIYLNGTILGMRKKEIDARFDEIVDFSGVEHFLDTPVKRYSSGMRVRLAFSVAAHLDPEVLIIDEVLAVGDAEFQRKCLEKMQSVGEQGKTVLFVSHSMPAVTRMCRRVILLHAGRVIDDGSATAVVNAYMARDGDMAVRDWSDKLESAPSGDSCRLLSVSIRNKSGEVTQAADIRESIYVQFEYEVLESGINFMTICSLVNAEGYTICLLLENDDRWGRQPREPGRYVTRAEIPGNFLAEGSLWLNTSAWVTSPARKRQWWERNVVAFSVVDTLEGDSLRGAWMNDLPGFIRPKLNWETDLVERASGQ